MATNLPRFHPVVPTRRGFFGLAGGAALLLASSRSGVSQGLPTLRAQATSLRLRGPGEPASEALGFNGTTPGPTLRVPKGREFNLSFVNDLAQPVSLWLPGMRGAPPEVSGLPGKAVDPGETRTIRVTPRDAGTFWYRSFTPSQSARGLHGMLVVEDGYPVDREVSLVIGTWPVAPDGTITAAGSLRATVNGVPTFDVSVRTNQRIRFRLLNASRNQLIALRFDKHQALVIALDGQPAEPFEARDGVVSLAPGNRADVLVDMVLAPGSTAPISVATAAGVSVGAQVTYAGDPPVRASASPPPGALPANSLPAQIPFGRAMRADLTLDAAATVPGRDRSPAKLWASGSPDTSWPDRPVLEAKRGQTVMLAIRNPAAQPQCVHIAGHPFRLLDALDDGWKPYWLDTLMVPPQQTARLAFVAETAGRWPIVWQTLQTSDATWNAWFQVA